MHSRQDTTFVKRGQVGVSDCAQQVFVLAGMLLPVGIEALSESTTDWKALCATRT